MGVEDPSFACSGGIGWAAAHCFTMHRLSPTIVHWRRDDGKSGRARLGAEGVPKSQGVTPHPVPLPSGRGDVLSTAATVLPLPWGEGSGRGNAGCADRRLPPSPVKQSDRRRCGDGRRPLGQPGQSALLPSAVLVMPVMVHHHAHKNVQAVLLVIGKRAVERFRGIGKLL